MGRTGCGACRGGPPTWPPRERVLIGAGWTCRRSAPGAKPGTDVFTVRSGTMGVPTLVIGRA